MNTLEATKWTAGAITTTIRNTGSTVLAVSENTCITRPTLIRKLRGHGAFTIPELIEIAAALDVPVVTFIPPALVAEAVSR